MAACKSCGAAIAWAKTPEGANMPVNRGSAGDPSGTLAVRQESRGLVARVLTDGEELKPGEFRGITHWATCKQADDHRRGTSGWSHNRASHRWEWRDKDGVMQKFVHDQVLAQGPWSLMRKYGIEQTGEFLPDEAKPKAEGDER